MQKAGVRRGGLSQSTVRAVTITRAVNDLVTPIDVRNCYRLALGRDPESEDVIADKVGQPRAALLPDFFSSSEFQNGVQPKLAAGILSYPAFRTPPDPEFKAWVAEFAPLSATGAQAVSSTNGWYALYHALFADPAFSDTVLTREALTENATFVSTLAFHERLDMASRIEGHIDLVAPHEIHGWAVDTRYPDRRLAIELWIEGAFIAATITDRYRPDLHKRFGGGGQVGFILPRPALKTGAGHQAAELREGASGTIVEAFQLSPSKPAPLDAVVGLRRELAEVRELLSRIEARLPNVNEAFSFRLDEYDEYFRIYYGPTLDHDVAWSSFDLAVVIDASHASAASLDATMASLHRQRQAPAQVVVVHPGKGRRLDFARVTEDWRPRLDAELTDVDGGDWAQAMASAVAATSAAGLILTTPQVELAPQACGLVSDVLKRGALLVYGDSDTVEAPAGRAGHHYDPRFRGDFDLELHLQQGDLGEIIGVSRAAVAALDWRRSHEDAGPYGIVLQLLAERGRDGVVHIPRVLSHTFNPPSDATETSEARRSALQDYLDASGETALIETHHDPVGASIHGAFRIRRSVPPDIRAAVIIPTRDRLDLLAPCLTSLGARLQQNRTQLEIVVVDNQSEASETHAFLDEFAKSAPLRVLRHDGDFNWALINNYAAAQLQTDILIFLNNDTVAFTSDWCDELCSQAVRPGIGAVGARLLYGDGTIQHAGMITGGWHAFTDHEGRGARGNDPGYLGRHALVREVSAVTGACLATRADLFREVGGFDAVNLPVEGNDVDYCFRVQQRGLRVLYDPYCTLYHYESKSRGHNKDFNKWQEAEAAGALLRARWANAHQDDPAYNAHFDRLSAPLTRLRPPPLLTI